MKYLFFAIGLALGVIQFFLTKKLTDCLTAKNNSGILICSAIKLAVYAAAVSIIFIFANKYLVHSGIGYAAGMIPGAFINFIISAGKDKSNKKGDDTP